MRYLFLIIFQGFLFACYPQEGTSIYQKAINSVVTITTDNGSGSGFFVSKNEIVTCLHVVEGATDVFFYTNFSPTRYHIQGYLQYDKTSDLVLLYCNEITGAPLIISRNDPQPGQHIFTLGSPRGMDFSISDGIVSGIRKLNGTDLIQITAPISSGNSGGPVINQNGELVGVLVGHLPNSQNLNFAIPNHKVRSLISSKGTRIKPLINLQSIEHKITHKEEYISKNFKYGESQLIQALIEYSFPLVIDNAGNSLQITFRRSPPEYGEYCFFFSSDLDEPELLAYGTVSSVGRSTCNIEIVESISKFNNQNQFLILFEHELK